MPWAALLLTAGFALREVGAFNYTNVDILIANTVLIMSGPPVYAAINYLVLSRVLYYVPYLSPIHPGRVLTTFLAADSLCEILIGNGASRMVNTSLSQTERTVGEDMVKAALILQACLFMLFVLLAVTFQIRASRRGVLRKNLRTVLTVMYISCTIVTARCIYRIVEFFLGYTGYVYTHEPFLWVFEASIMFVNTVMLNIWHPGRYLPHSNKVFLAKDGETELRGPGWSDKRPWAVTFFDPFDFYGLCMGRDSANKFWELSPDELAAMDAQMQQEKARKATKPRSLAGKVFDPFHLFGSNGLIMQSSKKRFAKEDEANGYYQNASTPGSRGRGDFV